MKKTLSLIVMILSCLMLFGAPDDGSSATEEKPQKSDSIDVTLEFTPKHIASFYKDKDLEEVPTFTAEENGWINPNLNYNKHSQLTTGVADHKGDYARSFYLAGTSNFAFNDYPEMKITWTSLSKVYPKVDESKTINMSVYVDKGWCDNAGTEYAGDWVDGNGNSREFGTSFSDGDTGVKIKGFAPADGGSAAIGEHVFYYKLVAEVSDDAYNNAEDGQYASTITVTITGA